MKNDYPSFLIHYGRSIKDGAPGVGTGNWRRGSISSSSSGKISQRSYRGRSNKTDKAVNQITDTFSPSDWSKFNGDRLDHRYYDDYGSKGNQVIARFLISDGDIPVAFLDLQDIGRSTEVKGFGPFKKRVTSDTKRDANVTIGVNAKYRGQGYANKVAKQGSDWIEKNKDKLGQVEWSAFNDNPASQNLAQKNGWKLYSSWDTKSRARDEYGIRESDFNQKTYMKDFRSEKTQNIERKRNLKSNKRKDPDAVKYY